MFRASLLRLNRITPLRNMASYTTDKASPFTRAVVSSMRKLYPEELADKSFDNTGLLLEAPFDPIRRQMNSVLLTIDLTKAVADEAIERSDCVVVAYHPIIFRGLKSLTLADTQQQSLLRLALEGISVRYPDPDKSHLTLDKVYSPHTAVDAAPGGLGDWLADIVTGTLPTPEPETHTASNEDSPPVDAPSTGAEEQPVASDQSSYQSAETSISQDEGLKPPLPQRPGVERSASYSEPTYPKPKALSKDDPLEPSAEKHSRTTIHPSPSPPSGFSGAGMGRLVTFSEPQPLTHIIERIARGVGNPKGFPVAIPQNRQVEDIQIRTVAVCAGSGGSVFKDVQADLLFTGELSHHEALAATERGSCVVTLFHSNSERGFLTKVMKPKLEKLLREEWDRVREKERQRSSEGSRLDGWEEALDDEDILVEVSEIDRDPFGIVILQASEVEGTVLEGGDK